MSNTNPDLTTALKQRAALMQMVRIDASLRGKLTALNLRIRQLQTAGK